jgi:hypothetical protein
MFEAVGMKSSALAGESSALPDMTLTLSRAASSEAISATAGLICKPSANLKKSLFFLQSAPNRGERAHFLKDGYNIVAFGIKGRG